MFLMIALVGVKGYRLPLSQYSTTGPIDRDTISLPRAVINSAVENTAISIAGLFKPAFDRLWHSCGRAASPYFDSSETWKLTARQYP
jgi:hypothetical protein